MPILARCGCGGKIGVGDAMAGRTVRCPKCGEDILVGAAGAPAVSKGAKPAKAAGPSFSSGRRPVTGGGVVSSSISINPAYIAVAVVLALVIGCGAALYFGPWRVSNDWAAMQPRANDEITDVVQYGMQAYLQQMGMFDTGSSHFVPHVDGPVMFFAPLMNFTMPPKIVFHGATTQGGFAGTYEPRTGEIAADVEFGGATVGGLIKTRKALGKFHMTGREKDGKVTAECNGAPLVLIPPTPPPAL